MTESRRVSRKFAERQAALVATAIRLINRRGVSGMTLADVGAELGLAPKAVAYYFRKKEDLAVQCFLHGLQRLDRFAELAANQALPEDRVAALVKDYFDAQRRAADGNAESITSSNDIRALASAPVSEAYHGFFRRVRTLLAAPDAPPADRIDLAARSHLVISNLHWAAVWLPDVCDEDYPRAGRRLTDVLLNGLASPGQSLNARPLPGEALSAAGREYGADDAFLSAATALINEQGYHGASVERISARLNLTKGAFYHHMASKDELVLACFKRSFDIYRRTIASAASVAENGLQALVSLSAALVERQITSGGVILRASAWTTLPEALQAPLQASFDRISQKLAALVSDGLIDGSIRTVDAHIAAQAIMALINSADELPYFARGITPEQADASYVRPCFEGLIPMAGAGYRQGLSGDR